MNKILCFTIVSFLFISGCATTGHKIDTAKVSMIQEGVTTEQEVIQSLGKPFMKTLNSDGKIIMLYQYTKASNRIQNFIPVVGLMTGGIDMKQQTLSILIDKDGKVEKYTMNDSDSPVNYGLLNTNK